MIGNCFLQIGEKSLLNSIGNGALFRPLRHPPPKKSLVCVKPVQKSHCWLCHDVAQSMNIEAFQYNSQFILFLWCQIGAPFLVLTNLFSCEVKWHSLSICTIYEPPRGKTNNVVSEQVRHKPTCTSTEES